MSVISENKTKDRRLAPEHGLSLWVEAGGRKMLFDTGQGPVLEANARQLNIPLEQTEAVILSHGHFDHAGGLAKALARSPRARIYAHPEAFKPKYSRYSGGAAKYIGVPMAKEKPVCGASHLVFTESPTDLGGGVFLTGEIPRRSGFEKPQNHFFSDPECVRPDILIDDQAMFLETPSGTIVILGCAHSGVVNTLDYVLALTGKRPIRAVLGGMHLARAGMEHLREVMSGFRRVQPEWLMPCHCTGDFAVELMRREFPGRCADCGCGSVFDFE